MNLSASDKQEFMSMLMAQLISHNSRKAFFKDYAKGITKDFLISDP